MGEYNKLRLVLRIFRYAILGVLALMTLLLAITFLTLPGTGDLDTPDFPGYLRVTDGNGTPLGNMDKKGAARSWLPITAMPLSIVRTTVFLEDAQFWYHRGLDLKQIYYALIENIALGSYKYGASTITQQLVKNIYLSEEKTILRKLKELMLTLIIESKLNKQQIMEWYLNIVELAPDIYGMENGARHYFDQPVQLLSYQDQVLLCNLMPAPRHFVTNRQMLRGRIHRIAGKLRKFDRINLPQYNALLKLPHPQAKSGLSVRYPGLRQLLLRFASGWITKRRATALKLSVVAGTQLLLEDALAKTPGVAGRGQLTVWQLLFGTRIVAAVLSAKTTGNSLQLPRRALLAGYRLLQIPVRDFNPDTIVLEKTDRVIRFSGRDPRLDGFKRLAEKLPVKR